MKHLNLNIEGMTCSACSNGLEKYLNKQAGVEAKVNLVLAIASIDYDDAQVTIKDLEKFIAEAGFKSLGPNVNPHANSHALALIIFFAILALFLMYLSMPEMFFLKAPNFLMNHHLYLGLAITSSILALLWGLDIIRNGFKNLIHGMPNMDSLVGLGVIVNFSYSLVNALWLNNWHKLYFDSVIMIILFVKIGRFIDKKNKAKAVDAIKNLVTLTPQEATILKNNHELKVKLNEIKKGDIVIAKPGEKIAVDGKITKGKTHTDESFITGEADPVKKQKGDFVLAGSLNYEGYIEYTALNIGKDSSISHIVDLVVEATNTKAPIARLADRLSNYFVPIIFLISLLSLALNLILNHGWVASIEALVTVLVVACPCALGLATPLAIVIAIGEASKKGLVIKSSAIIENLNKIDTVIFDKTGTLTQGKLAIIDFKVNKGLEKLEMLKIIQALEAHSNHPLAKSICGNIKEFKPVSHFKEISGQGVQGKINNKIYYAGNKKFLNSFALTNDLEENENKFRQKGETIVYLWNQEKVLAILGLRDEIKASAKTTIAALKALKKKIIMLSGDNASAAKLIAKELAIPEVYSEVSPAEKVAIVKKINAQEKVLMVGDGINDSPALKTATIGVSVAGGTDISNDAADIIMLSSDLHRLIDLFKIGAKTTRIIKENLFWALFYNLLMVPLATGLLPLKLNPMLASMAMVLSSLTVVLNSLRIKRY